MRFIKGKDINLIEEITKRYSKQRFKRRNHNTGLIDCNGFQIYSNDILKVYNNDFCLYLRILVGIKGGIYLINKDFHIDYKDFLSFILQNKDVKIEFLGGYKEISTLKDREFDFSIIEEI